MPITFPFSVLTSAISIVAILAMVPLGAQTPSPSAKPDVAWARIPAGTFQMGCVPADEGCNTDERPRHRVTLTKPFDLMITEVSVGMYRLVAREVDAQPVWSTTSGHPVVIVTWSEARTFCQAIGGRLPTEAEWEYAARGGREDAIYPWGNETPDDNTGGANGAAFERDAAQPVKSYGSNGYGLFDMAGNVWEWTEDAGSLYVADDVSDPQGPAAGSFRILRSGSFGDAPSNLRISNRTPNQPDRINVNVGFRCARDVDR